MFPPLRAVVFDLDGTSIDSRRDIAEAVNHVLVASGRPALPLETICTFIGDGALALVQRAVQLEPTDPKFKHLLDQFRAYYSTHATVFTVPYPGVRETLEQLSKTRLRIALCTNKPRMMTQPVLSELGLAHYFEVVICSDDLPFKKPHPAPLLHIAERLGLAPSELVMVGDGPQDILSGKAAGARTLAVTYGIKSKAEVVAAGPDAAIDSIAELWHVLTASTGTSPIDDRA